jgi:hypothetical protein
MARPVDPPSNHAWKFFRAGGTDQVRLETAADFLALEKLDQKLWVALSCPTRGLEFDTKTLELIDTDKDGRVRAPEVIAAVKWAAANLKNPTDLAQESDLLPLSAINDATDEGKQLLASAKRILHSLGLAEATAISVEHTSDTEKIFAQTKFNGDGVVPPESAGDAATQAVIADIISCLGGEPDRCGALGVTQAKSDQFYADLQLYSDWGQKAEDSAATVLPLGAATASAFDTLKIVRGKVDDYFTRCRLAAFDGRAANALNVTELEFASLAAKTLSASGAEATGFPLAKVEAGRLLPLKEGLNPAWASAMTKLHTEVVTPILGANRTTLREEDWAALKAAFAPHEEWLGSKAGASVEKLGLMRVREILAGNTKASLATLIAQDKALEPEMAAIASVDRLVRYYRDIYRLLNNFVSFRDFYSGKRRGVFQVGTLYLDGRSCDLCIHVEDPAKHGSLAVLSQTYLAYCECTRKGTSAKLTIAAAFTAGDSDNLMLGRNGVFYDCQGQDWDATIIKLIEHPISIRQAMWLPYKKLVKMIEGMIEKFAAAREKAAQDKAAAGIQTAAQAVQEGKPTAAEQAFDVGKTAGILAALGLALGGIGAAVAAFTGAFTKLPLWQKPIALLVLFLIVSGPSVLIAWLKLRQRNLGPILDANGWAINARAKINIPFGAALTGTAKLPPNAERSLEDPYAEKHPARPWIILLLIAALAGGAGYWYWRVKHPAKAPEAEDSKLPAPTNRVVPLPSPGGAK